MWCVLIAASQTASVFVSSVQVLCTVCAAAARTILRTGRGGGACSSPSGIEG